MTEHDNISEAPESGSNEMHGDHPTRMNIQNTPDAPASESQKTYVGGNDTGYESNGHIPHESNSSEESINPITRHATIETQAVPGEKEAERTPTLNLNRSLTAGVPGAVDPTDLPFRELTEHATLEEYTTETPQGRIVKPVKSHETGKLEDYELVTYTVNDPDNPKNWSKGFRWYITMVVAWICFVVAFCSSVITADFVGVEKTFGVSEEVALLTLTVFVVGFGVGKIVFLPGHFHAAIADC